MTRVVDSYGRPANVIDTLDQSRRRHSPQFSQVLKIEGGLIAIALALIALGGVIVAAVLLPEITRSQSEAAVAVALRPISAQVASSQDRAWLAERNSFATAEQLKILQAELAAAGKPVRLDGH